MQRPWNITEQVIEDPTTKLRIEFTSVHSIEVSQGRAAPEHDQIIYLRLWTSDRTRVATYAFTRGGDFIKTAVEHVDPGVHPKLEDGIKQHASVSSIMREYDGEGPVEEVTLRPHDENGNVLESELTEFEKLNYAKDFTGDI